MIIGDVIEAVRACQRTGTCELCNSPNKDLRPYGDGGKWICFTCGMKDEETTTKNFHQQQKLIMAEPLGEVQ